MWLLLVSVAVVFAVGLALWSFEIRLHVQGRGRPDGAWALAGALQVGPLVTSFVQAAEVPARVTLRILGKDRKIWPRGKVEQPTERKSESQAQTPKDLAGLAAKVMDWLLFLITERRRIQVKKLDLDLSYGFSNVALTGKVAAALYALSGVLPAPIRLQHHPAWVAEDRAEFSGVGSVKVFLLALLWDTAKFMLSSRKRPSVQAPNPENLTAPDPESHERR